MKNLKLIIRQKLYNKLLTTKEQKAFVECFDGFISTTQFGEIEVSHIDHIKVDCRFICMYKCCAILEELLDKMSMRRGY